MPKDQMSKRRNCYISKEIMPSSKVFSKVVLHCIFCKISKNHITALMTNWIQVNCNIISFVFWQLYVSFKICLLDVQYFLVKKENPTYCPDLILLNFLLSNVMWQILGNIVSSKLFLFAKNHFERQSEKVIPESVSLPNVCSF